MTLMDEARASNPEFWDALLLVKQTTEAQTWDRAAGMCDDAALAQRFRDLAAAVRGVV